MNYELIWFDMIWLMRVKYSASACGVVREILEAKLVRSLSLNVWIACEEYGVRRTKLQQIIAVSCRVVWAGRIKQNKTQWLWFWSQSFGLDWTGLDCIGLVAYSHTPYLEYIYKAKLRLGECGTKAAAAEAAFRWGVIWLLMAAAAMAHMRKC